MPAMMASSLSSSGRLRLLLDYVLQRVGIKDVSAAETGIKTMAQGNIGIYEHVFSGTYKGRKWQSLSICIYEFSGDKIQSIRTVYNKLSMAKQVAAGVLDRWVVGSLVGTMEKGLR